MIKRIYFISIFLMITLLSLVSCAPKGVICSKGAPEEKGGYQGLIILGDKKETKIRESLCNKDIDKILSLITTLDIFQKQRLKELTCGEKASSQGFYDFFSSLEEEAKADIIRAFATYSYYIHGYG